MLKPMAAAEDGCGNRFDSTKLVSRSTRRRPIEIVSESPFLLRRSHLQWNLYDPLLHSRRVARRGSDRAGLRIPAGVPVDLDFVNRELWRRQQGYGRGGRMKIETDQAHILSGVRHGKTIGSPIAIQLINRDWKNWQEKLPVETGDPAKHRAVASPRPGHADLAGALKYNFPDARYVLERASARESAARVAAGAFAKLHAAQPGH